MHVLLPSDGGSDQPTFLFCSPIIPGQSISQAPNNILSECGSKVKIIALLREPVARIQSQFLMRLRLNNGGVHPTTKVDDWTQSQLSSFERVVGSYSPGKELNGGKKAWWTNTHREYFKPSQNAIFEGLYVAHITRWQEVFSREDQMLIYFSIEFFAAPARVTAEVLSFVGLDPTAGGSVNLSSVVATRFNTVRCSCPSLLLLLHNIPPLYFFGKHATAAQACAHFYFGPAGGRR